jgi:hypothetical protein
VVVNSEELLLYGRFIEIKDIERQEQVVIRAGEVT